MLDSDGIHGLFDVISQSIGNTFSPEEEEEDEWQIRYYSAQERASPYGLIYIFIGPNSELGLKLRSLAPEKIQLDFFIVNFCFMVFLVYQVN